MVFADEGGIHTPDYCSIANIKSCAHLRFDKFPTTSEEGEFIVHITPANPGTLVTDLTVKLWMDMGNGHGHSSAPVEITPMDEANHFQVQNAWFVMRGTWNVIITYKEAGILQSLMIPLQIKE